MITPEILATDSNGVTANLPRTQEEFMPALPEAKTKAPLAPAFTPERRTSVSASPSDVALAKRKAEADHKRLEAEAREVQQAERDAKAQSVMDAQAKLAEARAVQKAAEAEVRRQRDEQKRADKEARAQEKAQREQEVRDKKAALAQAKTAGDQATPTQAEAAAQSEAPAGIQQAEGIERAVDNAAAKTESDEERAKAQAIAEARQRALEAEAQPAAQVEKEEQK